MTNEQKAEEIAGYVGRWRRVYGYEEVDSSPECKSAALAMADWKDKEFKKEKQRWIELLEPIFKDLAGYNCGGDLINDFIKLMDEQ